MRKGVVLAAATAAIVGGGFAGSAAANNLDRDTATDVARDVARKDCRNTSGCQDYRVYNLRRVSRHKAIGKLEVVSVKNGTTFVCTRQIVVKLDHFTGEVFYGTSQRRCKARV